MGHSEDKNKSELRDDIMDLVLSIYFIAAEQKGWTKPPPEVEKTMHEIFELVSVGVGIKE